MDSPYTLYRLEVSYFSGKLEAYLRYKGIPFHQVDASNRIVRTQILPNTGIAKVPVLVTPDGLWLQDTTPIIDFLEARHPEASIHPSDAMLGFFSRLLEDYADEWLWRPALHHRWSHARDARLLGRTIADAIVDDLVVPKALAARLIARRQFDTYVAGDGVSAETRAHVEGVYTATLERLEAIFEARPFLLGDRPGLADFGFFASMFRHFSSDPTPASIMRERGPNTFAWVGRLWAARGADLTGEFEATDSLLDAWRELLRDLGRAYLPYLHANAIAWRNGEAAFDFEIDRVRYRDLPVVQYRVWCRERLQAHFDALPAVCKRAAREHLESFGAWEPLWRDGRVPSHLHDDKEPPVCEAPRDGARRTRSSGWTAWNLPGTHDRRPGSQPR